jgi:drug/metabolite transporter (DMT)-like permease
MGGGGWGPTLPLPNPRAHFLAWIAPSLLQWLLLVVCGLLSVAVQLLMTLSLGRLTAVGLGIIQQATVVLARVGGIVFFAEPLSLRGAIGSVVTVAGVLWSVRAETAKA